MKKSLKVSIIIAIITCIISISGSYAATNYAISAIKIGYSDNSNLGADNVQAAIDGTCTKFSSQLTNLKNEVKTETINEMYPVGSIYISTSISTASELEKTLGVGTWESYASGKTLVGVGTGTDSNSVSKTFKINETGGEYTHNLTTSEIPSHSHTIPSLSGSTSSTGSGYSLSHTCETKTTGSNGSHSHRVIANTSYGVPIYKIDGNIYRGFISSPSSGSLYTWMTGVHDSIGYYDSNTGVNGEHTHSYADCYLNGLSGVEAHAHTVSTTAATTEKVGGSEAHNNIQPYLAVYMYKRTKWLYNFN